MQHFDAIFVTDHTDTLIHYKSLGAYKLASVLRAHGYQVLVIDHFHMWTLQDFLQVLECCVSSHTKFVGFSTTFFLDVSQQDPWDLSKPQKFGRILWNSCFCPQGKDFEDSMISKIKHLNASCKIVLGGQMIDQNLKNRNVDFVMGGFGELSILDLMQHLTNGTSLAHSYRNVWGCTFIQGKDFTGNEFSMSPMTWQPQDVINSKVLPLESARGCMFNCKFCSYPMRGKHNLDHVINKDLMYKQLQQNYDAYGIRTYNLIDDTFNDSDVKLDLVSSVVEKLSFQPIFWSYTRLDLLTLMPQRLNRMYDLGVRAMFFGIETLNQKTGKIIGKGLNAEKQIDTIRSLKSRYHDLMLHASFILGLPGDSLDSMHSLSQRLITQDIPVHSWRFNPLRIAVSRQTLSEFDKNWQQYGYVTDSIENRVRHWRNEYTTYKEVRDLSDFLNEQGQESEAYHHTNQFAWAMMNYPQYPWDRIRQLKYRDTDWHDIAKCKLQYVKQYQTEFMLWLEKHH